MLLPFCYSCILLITFEIEVLNGSMRQAYKGEVKEIAIVLKLKS